MVRLGSSRILITGVHGQVGFELVKSLSCTGAELVLAARKAEDIASFGYKAVSLDMASESNIRDVLREVKPHLVINPAAYTAVDKAEDDRTQAFAVNERALRVICEELKALKGAIVHFSTDYVYNPAHDRLNVETDVTNPANVYAASKLAGEQVVQASGIAYVILRTSWVYGINGNNFVKTMLRLARDRESLRIVDDQVGSPTHAGTLGQVVASILFQGQANVLGYLGEKSGIYNVSDSGFTNWHDFAQEIFRLASHLGIELKLQQTEGIRTEDYKTPAVRPLNSRLALDKLGKEFGIVTPKWQQSLAAFMHQAHIRLF